MRIDTAMFTTRESILPFTILTVSRCLHGQFPISGRDATSNRCDASLLIALGCNRKTERTVLLVDIWGRKKFSACAQYKSSSPLRRKPDGRICSQQQGLRSHERIQEYGRCVQISKPPVTVLVTLVASLSHPENAHASYNRRESK